MHKEFIWKGFEITELNLKMKVAETPCWNLVNKKNIWFGKSW